MKRIRLTVAYEGTNYCGWQIQPNGVTIEEVLNTTLTALLGEEIKVIGASRTDAGVHSKGNIAVFDTETKIPPDKLSFALNQRLPEDVVVVDSREVAGDWHPRRCESRKTYIYRILNRTFPDPLRRRDTYFFYYELDVAAMKEAAAYLIGEHDFASFASVRNQAETTVRTLYSCEVTREGDEIRIQVEGSGFLYNMVRIIAGTLVQVGNHRMDPKEIPDILSACDRDKAGPTAPACGLTMVGIQYEAESALAPGKN